MNSSVDISNNNNNNIAISNQQQQQQIQRDLMNFTSTTATKISSTMIPSLTTTTVTNTIMNLTTIAFFQFSAHNRKFQLLLKSQSETVFAQDIMIESTGNERFTYDMTNVIIGHLEDDEDSTFVGIITKNGLLDGHLQTKYEEFYIEPAERYFDLNFGNYDFHSVIYISGDVNFPLNATHGAATMANNDHHNFFANDGTTSTTASFFVHYIPLFNPFQTTTTAATVGGGGNWLSSFHQNNFDSYHDDALVDQTKMKRRQRRSTNISKAHIMSMNGNNKSSSLMDDNETTILETITSSSTARNDNNARLIDDDHHGGGGDKQQQPRQLKQKQQQSGSSSSSNHGIYWRDMDSLHYTESEPYGIKAVHPRTHWIDDQRHHDRHVVVDPKKTTCMLYLQADHLFYEKMGSEEACIESMTRHVQKVNNIYKNTDFDQDGRPDNISFLIKRIKVHTMEALKDPEYRYPSTYGVEKFLELFSEEDYDAFCLAYMFTYRDFEGGTLGLAWTGDLKNAGGVCEKNGHYRGSLKSLNTGIVTLLNYGKHVPPIVSHVTLAHEIGHNFGSPHDPEDDHACTPGGENGNYIMFARATSGDKRNNNKFSPCSLRSINAVLNTKAKSLKGCFQEPQDAICGNEVVEDGEECDCGWEEDCKEPCCFPMRANSPPDEPPCRLRPNVICSPSQGPCCTQDCKLKVGNKCRDDNGCRPQCPPSTNKANKTICNEEYVCYMGECTGSICMAYGLESCQCKQGPNDSPAKLCELCCRMPSDDSTCKSSFEWNTSPYDVPDLYAKPGTPCDNYNGYCDVNQRCREVDPSSPLATLRRLLLSNESMASLKRWFNEQWFYVAVLILITVLILLMAYKVFNSRRSLRLTKTDIMEVALEAVAKHQQEQQQAAAAQQAQQQQQQQAQQQQNCNNNNNNTTSESSSIGTNSTTVATTSSQAIHLQSSIKSTNSNTTANSVTNTPGSNSGGNVSSSNITNSSTLSSTKTLTSTTTTTTTTTPTSTASNQTNVNQINASPSIHNNKNLNSAIQQRNSIDSQSSSLIMDSYSHGKSYCSAAVAVNSNVESTYSSLCSSSNNQSMQQNTYNLDSIGSSSNAKSNYHQFDSSKHHGHHQQQSNLYGTNNGGGSNKIGQTSKTPSHALYFPSTNSKQQQNSALYHHPFSATNTVGHNNNAVINSIYGYTTTGGHHNHLHHQNQSNSHHHHSIPSLYHPSATMFGYPSQSLIPSQAQVQAHHQSYYDTAAAAAGGGGGGLAIVGHHNHPHYGTTTGAVAAAATYEPTYGRSYYGYTGGNIRNYPTPSAISYYQPSTIYDYLPYPNQTVASATASATANTQQQISSGNKPPPLPSMATHPSLLGTTTSGLNQTKNSLSSSSSSTSATPSQNNTNAIDPYVPTTTRRLYSSSKDTSTNNYGTTTTTTMTNQQQTKSNSNSNLHHFYYYPSSSSSSNNNHGTTSSSNSNSSNKFSQQHYGTVQRNKNGSTNRHYQHYFPSTLHNHAISNSNNNNNDHHFHHSTTTHQQQSLSSTRQHHSSHPQLLDTQAFSLPTTNTRGNQTANNLLTAESIYHSSSGHHQQQHNHHTHHSSASSFRRHTTDIYEPLATLPSLTSISHFGYSLEHSSNGHESDSIYYSSRNSDNFHQHHHQTTVANDSSLSQQSQQQQQQHRLHHSNSFHGHLDDLDHLLLFDQQMAAAAAIPSSSHHSHHHHHQNINSATNTIRSLRNDDRYSSGGGGGGGLTSTTTATNRSRESRESDTMDQITNDNNKFESNLQTSQQQQQQQQSSSSSTATTTNKQQQQHLKHPGSNGWV
ncbi:hypothetical protein HUG17_10439 [Dermatophagoides farinae]|uniref:ADAM10 endopeptidase n=1 Tax=Dermatophagoides farinae TaxID=6954 RepID=A0A9D4NQN3_DERFA|nr:hypothetical protein HUG17_10439 [Dermatophagoides farinae]